MFEDQWQISRGNLPHHVVDRVGDDRWVDVKDNGGLVGDDRPGRDVRARPDGKDKPSLSPAVGIVRGQKTGQWIFGKLASFRI